MVHRAHDRGRAPISRPYASSAALYEVGFNHFPAVAPGGIRCSSGPRFLNLRARLLEGWLTAEQIPTIPPGTAIGGELPSHPHPRLMPDLGISP